jgi:hypothetical protein
MTQLYFPSQVDLSTLDSGSSTFNALLMTKNSEEPDEDIMEVLLLLHVVPFNAKVVRQKINKGAVLKKTISATIALIEGSNKAEMWRRHNKIGVSVLKDLLVTKYTNSLPQQCDSCETIYQCHDSTGMHNCISCGKGFCPDCCPSDGMTNPFFHPLCSPCVTVITNKSSIIVHPNADSEKTIATPVTVATVPPPNPSNADDDGPETSDIETIDPSGTPSLDPVIISVPSTVASAVTSTPNPKICGFYARNMCRFGSKGTGCSHSHPKICHKWRKQGPKGCSKAKNCEFIHIKLCRSAIKDEECNNIKCNLPHLAKTKSTKHVITVRKTAVTAKSFTESPSGMRPTKSPRADIQTPSQDFPRDQHLKPPDAVILGLLDAVHLLGEQMKELIMTRTQDQQQMKELMRTRSQGLGQGSYLPYPPPQYSGGAVYYPQQPPPPHQQHLGHQAYPYQHHQLNQAVVDQPSR